MRLIVFDTEVFKHEWIAVFKDHATGHFTVIHNDPEALIQCFNDDCIYVGFNSKHYDSYIIKGIAAGLEPQELKELSDWIVKGSNKQPWTHPYLQDARFWFNNCDLMDDMQLGLSLKAIEGHMGMDIKETDVSFDLDRPLAPEELELTIRYCKHDVDATDRLLVERKDYLKNKINLGKLAGLSPEKSLSMTNAKLTAAMLKAEAKPHDDERKYVYPDNLLKQYIPQEVFDYFNRLYDPNVTDAELFSKGAKKLKFSIGECVVTIGMGGIHAAIPNFFWEQANGRIIRNYDVGSFYPHLCTINHYTSRNIPSPKIYEDVLETRMKAKAAGDKHTADALKLVCNTTYGAMLNQYNALYDPLMGRSVCISGQLYLLELAEHCVAECPTLRIVQLNTDGAMFEFDEADYPKVLAITDEWQQRTGFSLEEDKIAKLRQKDVNNYTEIQESGKAKHKGGYLVKGISTAGAWKINNSCNIVATALKEYFVNGTPVEDTINQCQDLFQFQIIAKAGSMYRESYHIVDGVKEPVQRVNRVYATADTRYGKLYKVKEDEDSESISKIGSLPEHCIVDNGNDKNISISDVDKLFYIEMAQKRVNDFKGIKPEKQKGKKRMATATKTPEPVNIYKRLADIRAEFAKIGIEKHGKNIQLRSMFFTLDDIVNTSRDLFQKHHILPLDTFTKDEATLTLLDLDSPDGDSIVFKIPMREYMGNAAVTPVQAMGATVTYYRRYLYALALDLAEKDELEEGFDNAPAAPASHAPATSEQRETVKQELTAPADNATDLQIKGLKTVLKKLREAQPDKEEMINKIAVQTQGFKIITKADCEAIIQRVTAMLEANNG